MLFLSKTINVVKSNFKLSKILSLPEEDEEEDTTDAANEEAG
jgi:hypothetical protein